MSDWSSDISLALQQGDPAAMKAMLSRVPNDVMQRALPYLEAMADNCIHQSKFHEALSYYSQLLEVQRTNFKWRLQRAELHLKLGDFGAAVEDAERLIELRPHAAQGYGLKAEGLAGLRQRSAALLSLREASRLEPNSMELKQRLEELEREAGTEALLQQLVASEMPIDPPHGECSSPPSVTFDPTLLRNPASDAAFDPAMVQGLNALLQRYSALQAPRNSIARLEDSSWTRAWDDALRSTVNEEVLLVGSELGVLALRARAHGAKRVLVAEASEFSLRLATGVAQKNLLLNWHHQNAEVIPHWSEEQRRSKFAEFARDIVFITDEEEHSKGNDIRWLAFPGIDHSLLGTGIVPAIRRFKSRYAAEGARVLPARAKIFAMPVEWRYDASVFKLDQINRFRWNFSPQPLELAENSWRRLCDPVELGEIDFENFVERTSELALTVSQEGTVDAIIFWFDLELASTRLSNAPGSALQCIKPAVQYCDSVRVTAGQELRLCTTISETRLQLELRPALSTPRCYQLPSWYVSMLEDRQRNERYGAAIQRALTATPSGTLLDIGTGCGLLAMMAARSGAAHVVGTEINRSLAQLAAETIQRNGFEERIQIVPKDCRRMLTPADMPTRADMAVFELFDCSLIGEGVLHLLSYARQHLLTENARYVPRAARIRAAVIEYHLDQVLGTDVTLLNPYRYSPGFINVDASNLRHRMLTDAVDVFDFEFATAEPAPAERELELPALSSGIAGAVLFWFDLQLDDVSWLSNSPSASECCHWKQGLYLLPEANVTTGTRLSITAKHDGSSLRFSWKPDGLPKASFSKLPRFDPRWWQRSKALEQQMQGVLERCYSSPDEFRKAAELTQRFAMDPARFEVDPIMAQRLAMMFMPH